jgi:hypothetical protein
MMGPLPRIFGTFGPTGRVGTGHTLGQRGSGRRKVGLDVKDPLRRKAGSSGKSERATGSNRRGGILRTVRLPILICCLVIGGAVGAAVLQVGKADAAPTYWSVTASPSPGSTHNTLNGVSCTSSTWCIAVGSYTNGSVGYALVESWDGSAWSTSSGSAPAGGLNGVSCTSSTWCVAVGSYGVDQTLVESWDGTGWSTVPSPSPGTAENVLRSVSCTSPTNCVAVGFYSDQFNTGDQTLVESWDGTAWSVVSSPSPSITNDLNSVSCTSSTWCVAVGSYYTGSASFALVESWDGTTWSINSNPGGSSPVFGVSCTSSTSCMAVGWPNSNVDALAMTWDGTSWSAVATPKWYSWLEGVSCTTPTNCVAVGYSPNGSSEVTTLAESWDGTAWSVSPSPSPGSYSNILNGVSCASSTWCSAVGDAWPDTSTSQTLIETGYVAIASVSGTPQ